MHALSCKEKFTGFFGVRNNTTPSSPYLNKFLLKVSTPVCLGRMRRTRTYITKQSCLVAPRRVRDGRTDGERESVDVMHANETSVNVLSRGLAAGRNIVDVREAAIRRPVCLFLKKAVCVVV